MELLTAQLVTTSHELPTLQLEGADVLKLAHLVVAAGEHLEHRLQSGAADPDALSQQPDEGLGARRHGLDPLRVVGGLRMLVEVMEMFADALVDQLSGRLDERLVEEPEPDAPSKVADRGVAQLGRDDQSLENLPDLVAGGPRRQSLRPATTVRAAL